MIIDKITNILIDFDAYSNIFEKSFILKGKQNSVTLRKDLLTAKSATARS